MEKNGNLKERKRKKKKRRKEKKKKTKLSVFQSNSNLTIPSTYDGHKSQDLPSLSCLVMKLLSLFHTLDA